ncbi:double-strand-break repair protein rad21-like protein 1 isoform X2 [Eleginops maclovinus]|uniref:double-strand-break repair protein rad21-like protein 1 isoform X2 n=1 Tax=Eleginops maclovinus TaxID=56733 RepID=UPI00307FEE26
MMFYTQLFTSKRGPLAKIWLAAHWEKKLTKAHIFECNLETTISDIISPQMNIGLRTSGHLLVGVVKIYSRKTKYLLADCSDALVKIRMAFRPGQTDLPEEALEATVKAITLNENFSEFNTQLPHPSNIDVDDHFSLNQCRSEDITLKEDLGNNFMNLVDFDFLANYSDNPESLDLLPEEPQISTLKNQQGSDITEVATPTLNEITLLANQEEGFALDPVTVTPNSEKKRGKRKRRLVVDQTKELSNESLGEQLSNSSDLVAPLDMAPPTRQLMQWKESGGVDKLFELPCSTIAAPQIKKLFARTIFQMKHVVHQDVEVMREDGQEAQRDITTDVSGVYSSIDLETTHNRDLTDLDHTTENYLELHEEGNMSEFTHPELPSEDSMFVHPSYLQLETQSTSFQTQSLLDSQDFEERKMIRHTQKLLDTLKTQSSMSSRFSLQALCEGGSRFQAATTFFCLLLLKKQKAIVLQQSGPYHDIIASPGPAFYEQ